MTNKEIIKNRDASLEVFKNNHICKKSSWATSLCSLEDEVCHLTKGELVRLRDANIISNTTLYEALNHIVTHEVVECNYIVDDFNPEKPNVPKVQFLDDVIINIMAMEKFLRFISGLYHDNPAQYIELPFTKFNLLVCLWTGEMLNTTYYTIAGDLSDDSKFLDAFSKVCMLHTERETLEKMYSEYKANISNSYKIDDLIQERS